MNKLIVITGLTLALVACEAPRTPAPTPVPALPAEPLRPICDPSDYHCVEQ